MTSPTISQLMTHNLITLKPDDILSEVTDLVDDASFHHFPVINDMGECVGVFSKTDYLHLQNCFSMFGNDQAKEENKKFFRSILIKEVMHSPPIMVDISGSFNDVLSLLLKNKFHSVIITKSGKCEGIITTHDILKYLDSELE